MVPTDFPLDEASFAATVLAFEDGTLPLAVWRQHQTHLIVSLWYLRQYPLAAATERIRTGIQRYNTAHGIAQTPDGGYHETITQAFIHLIRYHVTQTDPAMPWPELVDGLVAAYGGTRTLLDYYSRDCLMSWTARTSWVEPDVRPLPAALGT